MENYGSYQLLKRLATGGMAQIFLARGKGPDGPEKLQVVKRILPHLAENDEFVRMFLDEARIAARLNHPNVVQIYDLGAQGDTYFIAMEYIHGEDVRRVWKRAEKERREFPVELVCRIIMEACAGIDHAHRQTDVEGRSLGIVHRDISPQNILVTFEGGVKLVDFGIAKAADQATVTRSGVLKGKYSYMSPEQAAGQKLDGRSDIFALGIVLYELLTGTRLFKRVTDLQTLNAVLACEVMPPSEVNSRCPADLDEVVMRSLAKELPERYQHALELQAALDRWLTQKKLSASREDLAAFMRELYAERLAKEAQAGGPAFEEDQLQFRDDDPADSKRKSPISRSLKPDRPKATDFRALTDKEHPALPVPSERNTSPQRPQLMTSRPNLAPEELEGRTITESATGGPPDLTLPLKPEPIRRRKSHGGWIAGGVAALAAVAAGAWIATHQSSPPAVLQLTTEPPGATVVFAGRALEQPTPCTLPPVPAGAYTVVIAKSGYVEYRATLNVPETGEVSIPAIHLEAEAAPPAPVKVQLTVKTEPPGATVSVAGVAMGTTPVTLTPRPGDSLFLKMELAGYLSLDRRLTVGAELAQSQTFLLESAPEPRSARPGPLKASERRVGSVRFVVTPWAEVSCGPYKLGQTPFPDRQLPAGTYDCVFSHPELGTRTERVEVRANELARVTVRF